MMVVFFFFSSRRRHTRCYRDWSSDVCSSDLAGEPLNPEVIEQVRKAWGITVRDGFGQTETTAQVGNTPGQPVKPGSMGRPLPGYPVVLVDPVSGAAVPAGSPQASEAGGEICLDLSAYSVRPLGLMTGYQDDAERDAEA